MGLFSTDAPSPAVVIAAAVTPRRAGERSVDLAAMFELVDFLGNSGIDGIALFGSTGEFLHFELEDRVRVVHLAAKRSRVPMFVNVSHSTLDGALYLAGEAAKSAAEAVLLMPPYFFRYGQDAIRGFYTAFASEFNGALPVYLYNVPAFTNAIEAATAVDLLQTGCFAGIKDSSGAWEYFEELRAAGLDAKLLLGSESLYARGVRAGAHGMISGTASAVPELLVGLNRSILQGDEAVTARLEHRVAELIRWIFEFPALMAIKEAASLRGIGGGAGSIPLEGALAARLEEFRSWFRAWLPEMRKDIPGA